MIALVVGASGMLGQDLCPVLEDFGYDVIETNSKILDITKKDPWNFDLVIDFGILNKSYNQTNEIFSIDDFNDISIKISGLSLE